MEQIVFLILNFLSLQNFNTSDFSNKTCQYELIGSWDIKDYFLEEVSAIGDEEADSLIGKVVKIDSSTISLPFSFNTDIDTNCICTSVIPCRLSAPSIEQFKVGSRGNIYHFSCNGVEELKFISDSKKWIIFQIDGGTFFCTRQ